MKYKFYTLSALSLFIITAQAAEKINEPAGKTLLKAVLPLLIIIAIVFFLFKKQTKRNEAYMKRANRHMDRLEEQNDENISLLKEQKKSEQEDQPNS